MGLRELKKQRTRKAISDLATRLFIDRGYHAVTTAEIAELSAVSVPTLFNYFPSKEALVFDEDHETEEWLTEIVLNRSKDQTILQCLLQGGLKKIDEIPTDHKKSFHEFMDLVERTPELNHYAKQMWSRHEKTLGAVIRKESKPKLTQPESEAVARFVLDAFHRAIGSQQSKSVLRSLFKLLKEF